MGIGDWGLGIGPNPQSYHEKKELAARDIVSRAINNEMQETESDFVYLDVTFLDPDWLPYRFPTIYKACMDKGIDITKDYIPVAPIAHFSMGGIKVDIDGRTDVDGLYACGEAACTGVHGANRLASNSLIEGLVFGRRIARLLEKDGIERPVVDNIGIDASGFASKDGEKLEGEGIPLDKCQKLRRIIKAIMMKKVGIVRNEQGMSEALREIRDYKSEFKNEILKDKNGEYVFESLKEIEVYNMLDLAEIVITAALARKENIGGHYRSDCV